MDQVFTRYIELVGQDKVKDDLKKSIQQAITEENWDLVKEITRLIEEYFNK